VCQRIFWHYSIRTEQAYIDWIKRVILFHHKRHPVSMGAPEVEAFLTHLAVERHVAASTQRQALSPIVFLYREISERDFGWLQDMEQAKKPERLPVVLSRAEVRAVLARLDGQIWLMASLLYGAGLRLMECIRLRIKDTDFEYRQILVRDGKGQKDRVTMLPQIAVEPLKMHLQKVKALHEQDLTEGFGEVYLPFALNQSAQDSYTHAARFACRSAASCSTAAVTSGASYTRDSLYNHGLFWRRCRSTS
jgi:site-specific recombinase XerD